MDVAILSDEQVLTMWGRFPVGDTTLRTCAWCGASMGEIACRCGGIVTHGICQSCFERETGHGGTE